MDAGAGTSSSFGTELDGDTKPLVDKDSRVMLSRQAPVLELGSHIMTPLSTPPEEEAPGQVIGEVGEGSGALPGPSTGISRPRRAETSDCHSLSEQYYGTSVEVGHLPPSFGQTTPSKERRTRQSRRLPFWVWFILAKSLGIRVRPGDLPWFGTVMYGLTLTFALGFAITHSWYKAYDIVSDETKETVLTGLVSILLVIYWCCLGIYSHKLSGRLFMTPKFLDSVRLHSKTVFKISAAGMMVLLGVSEVVINCVQARHIYDDAFCQKVSLNVEVCKTLYVMRVGCCILTITWNLLVGIILLSVCRTHTIGLRRFIRELEEDGRIYEVCRRNMSLQGPIRLRQKEDDSTDEDNLMWEEDYSPTEDDGVFPKILPYHFAQASPCHTPTHKSSRHTSQTSATTNLPESISNATMQNFTSINSRYFPANPNYPNYSNPGTLSHHNLQTVEAEMNATSDIKNLSALPKSPNKALPTNPSDNKSAASNAADKPSTSETAKKTPIPSPEKKTGIASPERKALLVSQHSRPIIIIREGSIQTADDSAVPESSDQQHKQQTLIAADPPSFASRSTRSGYDSPNQSTRVELGSPRQVPSSMADVTDRSQSVDDDNLSLDVHMLTTDEILLIYWKLGSRLRSTSLVLQRWLVAFLMFIIIWSVTIIIWWVNHEATLTGISEFIIPILLLPIICSAYGEVNFEGQRMLKSICPTQQRMNMLFFMTQNPLQLTAFGFAINYGLIAGAMGALGIAFCTRLVLDEVKM